jgi:hypothetical protein
LRDDQYKEFEEVPEEVEGEEDAERRGIPGDLIWVQDQVSLSLQLTFSGGSVQGHG